MTSLRNPISGPPALAKMFPLIQPRLQQPFEDHRSPFSPDVCTPLKKTTKPSSSRSSFISNYAVRSLYALPFRTQDHPDILKSDFQLPRSRNPRAHCGRMAFLPRPSSSAVTCCRRRPHPPGHASLTTARTSHFHRTPRSASHTTTTSRRPPTISSGQRPRIVYTYAATVPPFQSQGIYHSYLRPSLPGSRRIFVDRAKKFILDRALVRKSAVSI